MNHLYAIAKGKVDMTATGDIYSARKRLLFKSGSVISIEDYESHRKTPLLHPFEEYVTLVEKIAPNDLYQKVSELVEDDHSLRSIDQKFAQREVLSGCCKKIFQYPRLDEIVTLFFISRPQLFAQSLRVAYLAYVFGISSKYPQEKIEALFIAGLLHDIGLLFISPKITNKVGKLTGEEWAKIQLHPIIGYKMLRNVDNFPLECGRAVLDHHECVDGSGYCRNKKGDEIHWEALVVSIMDDVVAIYQNKLKPIGRNLSDLEPTILMNTHGYPRDILSGTLALVKCVEPSVVKRIDLQSLHVMVEYTYQQQLYINKFFDVLTTIDGQIKEINLAKDAQLLKDAWERLSMTITSSGINESSYMEWLLRLESEEDWIELYTEIEFTRLMLEEVIYEMNNFYNNVSGLIPKSKNDDLNNYKVFTHVYMATQRPTVPEMLQKYWDSHPYDEE
ncbi:hypothetical protein AB835_12805 [Candidatus Endobugula sertula]|uniref:HD-GYP domain-containing protein n=1 Tax=Candidatus Endobugula sertula TaxID=62101 RepID=A0A1D2QM98_9GAMM|nr:hypothetical protein AB835_12805 [Candidatus Endobugula sertula]